MAEFFGPLFSAEGLITLLTLAMLEIVLGIDNIVFISILTDKLSKEDQKKTRTLGLSMALIMRIILLFLITIIVGLTKPITILGFSFSIHDIILFAGGLFLIYKSTFEIHSKLEGEEEEPEIKKIYSIFSAVVQIVLIDIVFSFDSILTAIGLVDDPRKDISIMVIAIVIAMVVMLFFSKYITDFINEHPTVKMLALSFLLMIGVLLVVESFKVHVPKGYVYFAMAFSLFVEFLNMRLRKKSKPLKLKGRFKTKDNDPE